MSYGSQMAEMSVNVLTMWNATPTTSSDFNVSSDRLFNTTHGFIRRRPGFYPGKNQFSETMSIVQYYGIPIIFALGMIGNILTYLVFTRSRFRKVPSVPYLSGIAVADSGFLCTYFFTKMTYNYRLPIMSQVGVCQFGTFINFASLFLSMWYAVAVVVEKFISVYWPLKKVSLCTVFRAKVVLISISVLAVVSHSYVIYFFGPDKHGICRPWDEFQEPFQILLVLDNIVASIAPMMVIITLVLLITVRGCEYYRISSASEFGPRTTTARNKSSQTTLRATGIVFSLVALILITHLPNSLVRVIGQFSKEWGDEKRLSFDKYSSVASLIYLVSFAVKFLVYSLVSRSFRKHLKNFLYSGRDRVLGLCHCNSSSEADPQRISLRNCGQGQPVANACLIQSDV